MITDLYGTQQQQQIATRVTNRALTTPWEGEETSILGEDETDSEATHDLINT